MFGNVETPSGWTERNMPNGWIRRIPQPADKKVKELARENAELRDALKALEDKVNQLVGAINGRD